MDWIDLRKYYGDVVSKATSLTGARNVRALVNVDYPTQNYRGEMSVNIPDMNIWLMLWGDEVRYLKLPEGKFERGIAETIILGKGAPEHVKKVFGEKAR